MWRENSNWSIGKNENYTLNWVFCPLPSFMWSCKVLIVDVSFFIQVLCYHVYVMVNSECFLLFFGEQIRYWRHDGPKAHHPCVSVPRIYLCGLLTWFDFVLFFRPIIFNNFILLSFWLLIYGLFVQTLYESLHSMFHF